MTEFETLLKAYLNAESREKREAAYTALYEHCRNRDELDTLFEEFRIAKTVKKRNDVFTVLFFLRKEGKLDLSRIPEDLSQDLCMLYDDTMFEEFDEVGFCGGDIDFYFKERKGLKETEDDEGNITISAKDAQFCVTTMTLSESEALLDRFNGKYIWQEPYFRQKYFILSETEIICFVDMKALQGKDEDLITSFPLTSVDRAEHVKHRGIDYVIVFDKDENYIFTRLAEADAIELAERIKELKEIVDRNK